MTTVNSATRGATSFEVVNPATLEVVGRVPDLTAADAESAILRAHKAFSEWRHSVVEERAHILKRAARIILDRKDDLAQTLTLENGKPLRESLGELAVAAQLLEWDAEEGKRAYGHTMPKSRPSGRYFTITQPIGVVAALTPWNFPASMVTRKAGPALAAGCTVVLQPAATTPLTALALQEIFHEAGVPRHAFQVVTSSNPAETGECLVTHELVRKVTFTGSTAVGAMLSSLAAKSMKRVSMELGGNAPFIAFSDVDVELLADSIIASRFRNGGQSCIATNRLFADRNIARALCTLIKDRISALRVGHGLDPETQIGPVINQAALDRLARYRDDALQKGSRLLTGGKSTNPDGLPGFFFEPTLVGNVPSSAALFKEETFGPILPVVTFEDEEDVIGLANSTRYGLAAYIFTNDLGRAMRVSEELEFGVIGINDLAPVAPILPFGGFKESGVGRECGTEGIMAFLETKSVSLAW
jgi:succinate-semialdehyde dehydrogenase / glutarate-semialdehyde dehydrogenase